MSERVGGATTTDEELLGAIQLGSRDAFDKFYSRHRSGVRRRVDRLVGGESASDDIVQETFVTVWTKSVSWTGTGAPIAWVYRIANNLALNYLRSRNRRREAPLDQSGEDEELNSVLRRLESHVPGPDTAAERQQVIATVRHMIDTLPESKREVMDLVHTEDFSVTEVAEALGIPSGTVKSRLHYGRLAIEDHIREFFDEEGGT